MRSKIAAASLALALAVQPLAAFAQSSQMPETGAQPPSTPTVKALNIIDINELPDEAKTKVEQIVAQSSKADREGMKNALDRSPAIGKALAAKGANSSMVVATNLANDGTLTLVTKKKG